MLFVNVRAYILHFSINSNVNICVYFYIAIESKYENKINKYELPVDIVSPIESWVQIQTV